MKKKGQSEAFGLAIIMLILVIAGVVFLLHPKSQTTNPKAESENIINYNYAYSLVRSDVVYGDAKCVRPMTSLLRNYFSNSNLECQGQPIDMKQVIINYIDGVNKQTLDAWQKDYDLYIYQGSQYVDVTNDPTSMDLHFSSTEGCEGKNRLGVAKYPLIGITIEFGTC